jgi:hypothetical protein
MQKLPQSAFLITAALTPLVAQADLVELTDSELRTIQGQGTVPGFREAFRNYRSGFEPMWTELTTIQGVSPAPHYAGWSSMLAGYTIITPAIAALAATYDAPFPVNRLGAIALTAAYLGAAFRLNGIYLLYLNGEYVPAY